MNLTPNYFNIIPVLLKKFCGEEGEKVDVQKLFGYLGLFSLVALWWLGSTSLFQINITEVYKFEIYVHMKFLNCACISQLIYPKVCHYYVSISVWPLTALGIEPKFSMPHSTKVDEVVVANGLIGSVLSDYFWYVLKKQMYFYIIAYSW